jgi:hypothetical protein
VLGSDFSFHTGPDIKHKGTKKTKKNGAQPLALGARPTDPLAKVRLPGKTPNGGGTVLADEDDGLCVALMATASSFATFAFLGGGGGGGR